MSIEDVSSPTEKNALGKTAKAEYTQEDSYGACFTFSWEVGQLILLFYESIYKSS